MSDLEFKTNEDKITNIIVLLNTINPLLLQIKKEVKSIDVFIKKYKFDTRDEHLIKAQKNITKKIEKN